MKRFVSLACMGIVALLCSSGIVHAQGLAERRAVKEYQDTKYKELESAIQAAAGIPVPIKVDWDKIALPGEAANYMNEGFWTNIFFKPLADALSQIAKDDMGKEALKTKLKEIHITYDEATAPASNYPSGVTFDGSKLSVNFRPWSNADDVAERTTAIREALEAKL